MFCFIGLIWGHTVEKDGVQIVRPLDPHLGGSIPPTDSAPMSANNEHIFYNLSAVLWVSDDAESIYEILEVPINLYNRLPVTIDIGHQSQGHFHFAMKLAIGSYRQNAIAIESEAGDSLT